mgnify:CR=1 FL=1
MIPKELVQELIRHAQEAREHAYAPYSKYLVGAALLDADGRIWTGCNVENASFGATVCAERVALFKMVSAGVRAVEHIAVVTEDGAPPCGICLQTLQEFAPRPEEAVVVMANNSGAISATKTLRDLAPMGFGRSN